MQDVIQKMAEAKWRWTEHVAKQQETRWTKIVMQWKPRTHKQKTERPKKRWLDDIYRKVGRGWHKLALD